MSMKLLSRLNDVKIRKKFMILYIFCVIVPIVVINWIFYLQVSQKVMAQEMDALNLSMDNIRTSFSTNIEQCVRVCEMINVDKRLNQSLDTVYKDSSDYIDEYRSYLESEVGKFIVAYNHMSKITIYVSNKTIINGGNYAYLSPDMKGSSMYHNLYSQNKPQLMLQLNEGDQKVVSILSKWNSTRNSFEKMIKIDLNNDMLGWIATRVHVDGDVYLFNDKGDKVFQYIKNKEADTEKLAMSNQSGQIGNDIVVAKEFGTGGIMEGWRLVGVFSNAKLVSSLQMTGGRIILIALLLFSVASFFLIIISYSFEKRLKGVSSYLKSARAAEQLSLNIEPGKDEIGILIMELNNRVAQNHHLIDVVYKGEIEKARVELLALQSQIHPHFLYNTLNSIRLKSVLKGELETADIIKRLALLFRRIMNWQDEFIFVKEEVDFIVDYLEIQSYRYESKLTYSIDVEEEAMQCKIPKMVLQPLVENASFHGIEMSERDGVIKLIIRKKGNELICVVRDNGIGIEPEKLENINSIISGKGGVSEESIGIYNVYKRLNFYYEDKMSIRVISFPAKGTTVVIRITLTQ